MILSSGTIVCLEIIFEYLLQTGETSPGSLSSIRWSVLLHLADFICCLLIILPIMWSIRQIRIASAADGKAQQTLDRLTQFQSFYLYTVCYLYFTRIIVYLLVASLPYNNYYFAPLLSEIAAVAYYAGTGTCGGSCFIILVCEHRTRKFFSRQVGNSVLTVTTHT